MTESERSNSEQPNPVPSSPVRPDPAQPNPVKRNHARSVLEIAVTEGICLPLGLIAALLVARTLGPELRGVLSFMMLLESFVVPIAALGFGNAVTYSLCSRNYQLSDSLASTLLVATIHGVVISLLFGALWMGGLLGPISREVPLVLGIISLSLAPIRFCNLMLSRVLVGCYEFRVHNVKVFLASVGHGLLSILLVCVLQLGLAGAVVSFAIFAVIECVFMIGFLWQRYRPRLAINRSFIAFNYKYGLKSWIGNLAARANLRIDQVFLSGGSSESLGLYSVAIRISELMWIVPDALAGVLFNRIAGMKSDQDRLAMTVRVHRTLLMMMLPLGLLGGVLGFWVIPWVLGPKYDMTANLVAILVPGTVAFISFKVTSKYFGASGRPEITSLVQLLSFLLGLAFYGFLIWLYGVTGAAVASSLTYIATSIFAIFFLFRSGLSQPLGMFQVDKSDWSWFLGQVQRAIKSKQAANQKAETEVTTAQ